MCECILRSFYMVVLCYYNLQFVWEYFMIRDIGNRAKSVRQYLIRREEFSERRLLLRPRRLYQCTHRLTSNATHCYGEPLKSLS